MVILIASDQAAVRLGLAERLQQSTRHQILTAASVSEMEEVAHAWGGLDLLLFSPSFSTDGKEARSRLRERFPGINTLSLDDQLPLDEVLQLVLPWLPPDDLETDPAGFGTAAGTPPAESGPADFPPSAPSWDSPLSQDSEREVDQAPDQQSVGDYDLVRLLRETDTTLIYKGVQRSVQREVVLERLRPELAADPEACRQFRSLVRIRASVSHPAIAAVYEAQEAGHEIFYTRELVRGDSLPELAASAAQFPQNVLLQMLLTTSEAFVWMEGHGIPHEPLSPQHVYLSQDGTARIANIACPVDPANPPPSEEGDATASPATRLSIVSLAEACVALAESRNGQTRELSHVVGVMKAQGPHAVQTWKQLARESRAALLRLSEVHTSIMPESPDRLLARRRLRVRQGITVALLLGVAGVVSIAVSWWRQNQRAKVRPLDRTVVIPAGEFIFRSGQKVVLPAFDIDQYEVTLAAYSAFLDALPHGEPDRFDHPDQPPTKTGHQPRDWREIMEAARVAGTWKGHPITLNAPVFQVDWWDAWAYAKWKNRRLPTEEEWEKAARGPDGRIWPWGDQPDPKLANTGVDYSAQPSAGGRTDGFAWWCDADAMPGDVSFYGVHGMAGNVSEWTSTLVPDPDLPDVQVPVFRGGDFYQSKPVPLNASPWLSKGAMYVQPFLGFRTVSTGPPSSSPPSP